MKGRAGFDEVMIVNPGAPGFGRGAKLMSLHYGEPPFMGYYGEPAYFGAQPELVGWGEHEPHMGEPYFGYGEPYQ